MAYARRKNTKRTYRRRPRTRRYTRRRRPTNYSGANARPFSDKYRYKMRYCEEVAINGGVATFGFNTFSMNSLFDPNTTGTGHQPMGFDQLAAIYNRYIVTGAKITATFAFSPADAQPSWVGLTVHENSTFSGTSTPVEELIEQGKTVYRCISAGDGGQPIVTLSRSISHRKEFSVRDLMGNIEEYGALVTGSPANGLFATAWIAGAGGLSSPGCDVMVKIEYTGYFTEPVLLGAS